LARVGGTSVSGELIKALKDSDPWVANSAAIYLGRYGGPEAISPLKEYLTLVEKEKHKRVAEEAIKFIQQRDNATRNDNVRSH
jgi:HEAT repeat protein